MKVLDLQCGNAHVFEGWFGSEDDFQDQRQRGLVQCPMCSNDQIEKRLSAPRINLGVAREPKSLEPAPVPATAGQEASARSGGARVALPPELQAAWLELARKVIANTEDVGDRFAQEARRIHNGETEERAIRGQASAEEAVELLEEGIAVLPLSLPSAVKETLQ